MIIPDWCQITKNVGVKQHGYVPLVVELDSKHEHIIILFSHLFTYAVTNEKSVLDSGTTLIWCIMNINISVANLRHRHGLH